MHAATQTNLLPLILGFMVKCDVRSGYYCGAGCDRLFDCASLSSYGCLLTAVVLKTSPAKASRQAAAGKARQAKLAKEAAHGISWHQRLVSLPYLTVPAHTEHLYLQTALCLHCIYCSALSSSSYHCELLEAICSQSSGNISPIICAGTSFPSGYGYVLWAYVAFLWDGLIVVLTSVSSGRNIIFILCDCVVYWIFSFLLLAGGVVIQYLSPEPKPNWD